MVSKLQPLGCLPIHDRSSFIFFFVMLLFLAVVPLCIVFFNPVVSGSSFRSFLRLFFASFFLFASLSCRFLSSPLFSWFHPFVSFSFFVFHPCDGRTPDSFSGDQPSGGGHPEEKGEGPAHHCMRHRRLHNILFMVQGHFFLRKPHVARTAVVLYVGEWCVSS